MILFFFLILLLAIAWGIADHYQANLPAAPPKAAAVRVEAPAPLPPAPAVPPRSDPGDDAAATPGNDPVAAPAAPQAPDKSAAEAEDNPPGKP